MKIMNMGEVPIITLRPLKLNKNPYIIEDIEYFNKRKENLIDGRPAAAL